MNASRILKYLRAALPLCALAAAVLALTALPDAAGAQNLGNATVTVTGSPAPGHDCPDTSVENWYVVPGRTYTVTLSGVTECDGGSIEVVLSWPGSGTYTASGGNGTYSFTLIVPAGACNTTPVKYCGGWFAHKNCAGFDKQVHLSAVDANGSLIDCNCKCTAAPVFDNCTDSTKDLGCNPGSVPDYDPSVTAHDNCRAIPVDHSVQTTNDGCKYTRTIVYTATNLCGTATCTKVYTWRTDTTKPVLPELPKGGDLGCNPAPPTCNNDLKATDNCDGQVDVVCAPGAVTGDDCNKSQTFTYTATDSCGNSDSKTVTYTWKEDTTAPVPPAAPANFEGQCDKDVPAKVDLTATDNCDGSITVSPVDGAKVPDASGCGYTITRTWTFVDGCKNSSSASQAIHIKDTTAPVPPDAPKDVEGQCAGDIPGKVDLTATDNCDGSITVSPTDSAPVNDTEGCGYTITRTWTFTDKCGNSASVSQKIHIKDTTAPVAPADGTSEGQCDGDIPAPADKTATDNCDGSITASPVDGPKVPDTTGCGYTIVRTWTFTDKCGNTSKTTLTIHIKDTTAPKVTCPADIDLPGRFLNSVCGNYAKFEATATDNCGGPVTITYNIVVDGSIGAAVKSGDWFPSGTTVVRATGVDNCGNSASCDFQIKVGPCEVSTLTLLKFNDANANGALDPGEGPMAGVKFNVCYTTSDGLGPYCTTVTTDASGIIATGVEKGSSYTVCEVVPSTGTDCWWTQTLPNATNPGPAPADPSSVLMGSNYCYAGVAASDTGLTFGNTCVCPPLGGLTPGFWSNKNGQKVMTGGPNGNTLLTAVQDALRSLNLRNGDGTFLYTGTNTPPVATDTITYAKFRTWILGATATNMAYMLSAQLAASQLNVTCPSQFGGFSGETTVVLSAGLAACSGKTTAKVSDIIAAAAAQLAANGYTTADSDPVNRPIQDCLKSILDGFNNNRFPQVNNGCSVNP